MSAALLAWALAAAALAWDPDATAAAPKRALLLLVALLALLFGSGEGRRPPAAVLTWLLAGALVLPHVTRPDALALITAACLVLALLHRDEATLREVAERYAVLCGLAGAAVLAQAAAGARGLGLHGGQGNPDWLALLLATAVPLTLARARRHGGVAWAALLLQLGGLCVARSRTAWIALVVSLALTARRRVALLALLLPLALVWASPRALDGRLGIARDAAAAAIEHPLGGQPFSPAFAEAQGARLRALPLAAAARAFVLTDSAHDDWLQAAVEGGAPALLALGGAFALAWSAHRRWRAGAATLCVIAVSACADAPLHQPAVLVLFALVLAACPSAPSPAPRWPLVAACAAALMLAAPGWLGERLASLAHREAPDRREDALALATRLDPRSPSLLLEYGLCAAHRHDAAQAIERLERARALGWQPATELALADAWLERGDPDRALALLRALLRRMPGSVRARLGAAEALRRLGREPEARATLAEAHRLWPGLPAVAAAQARLDEGY